MSDKEPPNINDLPLEVVSHIFSFLLYSDIKEARLVNKQWYEASQHPSLLDREVTVSMWDDNCDFQHTLLESSRNFLHLKIWEYCSDDFFDEECLAKPKKLNIWQNKKFWAKIGPKLRSLALGSCGVSRRQFAQVLQCCWHLRILELGACSILSISDDTHPQAFCELPNLQTLVITSPNICKAELFDMLVSSAPNLKKISLNDLTFFGLACAGVFTSKHTQDLLDKNSQRKFDLYLTCLEEGCRPAYYHLDLNPNVRLRGLQIEYSSNRISTDRVLELITGRSCLEELHVWCSVGDVLLGSVCGALPNLKVLKLERCEMVVRGVGFVFSLKKLTSLHLKRCHEVTSEAVLCGLCGGIYTTMKSLTITDGMQLSSAVLMELARTHPSLTYLDLSNSSCVTSSSVQAIFRYLVALQSLILAECENLDDSGLSGTRSDLATRLYPQEYSISCLKDLRFLDVSSCNLDGSCFIAGLKIPNIRHIILRASLISSEGFKCLAKNNRTIERLEVSFCHSVTDDVLGVIGENLHRLTFIDVEGCEIISENGVSLLKRTISGLKIQSHF